MTAPAQTARIFERPETETQPKSPVDTTVPQQVSTRLDYVTLAAQGLLVYAILHPGSTLLYGVTSTSRIIDRVMSKFKKALIKAAYWLQMHPFIATLLITGSACIGWGILVFLIFARHLQ